MITVIGCHCNQKDNIYTVLRKGIYQFLLDSYILGDDNYESVDEVD